MSAASVTQGHSLPIPLRVEAAGGFHLGIGVVLFSLGHRAGTGQERRKCCRWAAWFLVMAALQFSGGYLDMTALSTAPHLLKPEPAFLARARRALDEVAGSPMWHRKDHGDA